MSYRQRLLARYTWLLEEVWSSHPDEIDRAVNSVVTDDFVVHQARWDRADSTRLIGPEALATMIKQGVEAFDDPRVRLDIPPLVDHDRIAGHWTFSGTYNGAIPQASAPAGTPVSFSGMDIMRCRDERFREYWVCSDGVHLMTQLGLR